MIRLKPCDWTGCTNEFPEHYWADVCGAKHTIVVATEADFHTFLEGLVVDENYRFQRMDPEQLHCDREELARIKASLPKSDDPGYMSTDHFAKLAKVRDMLQGSADKKESTVVVFIVTSNNCTNHLWNAIKACLDDNPNRTLIIAPEGRSRSAYQKLLKLGFAQRVNVATSFNKGQTRLTEFLKGAWGSKGDSPDYSIN